jgi:hypothetical protein
MKDPAMDTLPFVDLEWDTRRTNRLKRLIRIADFPISGACMENIEYHADRKLDREQLVQLVTCSYIAEKHNVIIPGATGAGKTYPGLRPRYGCLPHLPLCQIYPPAGSSG